jgi:transcriptional regulator with XRE-family HTH domain
MNDDIITQRIAIRLRQARERAGLSQNQLAMRIGKSKQSISSYESGRARILSTHIVRIAVALNCSPDYLLTGAQAKPGSVV